MAVIYTPDSDKSSIDDVISLIKTAVYGKDVRNAIYAGLDSVAKSADQVNEKEFPITEINKYIEKNGVVCNCQVRRSGQLYNGASSSIEIPTHLFGSETPPSLLHTYTSLCIRTLSNTHVSFLTSSVKDMTYPDYAPLCDDNIPFIYIPSQEYKVIIIPENCQYILFQNSTVGGKFSQLLGGWLSEAGEDLNDTSFSSILMNVLNNVISSNVPAKGSSKGNPGDVAFDSGYLYVCVATDLWKRIELSSFS